MLSAHPQAPPVRAGRPCEALGSSPTPLARRPFNSLFSTVFFLRGPMSNMSAGHRTPGCIAGTMGSVYNQIGAGRSAGHVAHFFCEHPGFHVSMDQGACGYRRLEEVSRETFWPDLPRPTGL